MRLRVGVIAQLLSCLSGHSVAAGSGDTIVSLGWSHFMPRPSSKDLEVTVDGHAQVWSDSGSTIRNADTLVMTLSHFFSENVSAETGIGVPPRLHLLGQGALSSLGELGSARFYAAAVVVKYTFGNSGDAWRPALGAGISYIWYQNVRVSDDVASGRFLASPATGNALVGPTKANLDSTFAPVVHGSLSYQFANNWAAKFAVSYSPVKGKATLTTTAPVGTVSVVQRFNMNSISTVLSIDRSF